jgi:predicted dehydrogenase
MAGDVALAGVVNQVGLILRSSPAFHFLRHLIADPRAGRLMSIDFRDDQHLPVGGYYASAWRADYRKAGAGVLLEHSIHDVDILEFLAGPIARVSCDTADFHGLPGIEDLASARFDFHSGAKGTLSTIWHDIVERGNERRVDVLCERLWCSLDGSYWTGPIEWHFTGHDRQRAEGEELAEFARALGHTQLNPDHAFALAASARRPATPDFAVAERAHAVVDACYRSAAGGGAVVEIPVNQ